MTELILKNIINDIKNKNSRGSRKDNDDIYNSKMDGYDKGLNVAIDIINKYLYMYLKELKEKENV